MGLALVTRSIIGRSAGVGPDNLPRMLRSRLPAPPRSAFLAVVLGWLLPGLAQVYVGRPGRGLVMGAAICALFAGGLLLSAFTCVNPQTYELEFIAHALIGGPTALVLQLGPFPAGGEPLALLDVGRLYCAVAGLLNLVAICDALGEVLDQREAWAARRRLAAADMQVDPEFSTAPAQACATPSLPFPGDPFPLDPFSLDPLSLDPLPRDVLPRDPGEPEAQA